MKWSEHPEFQKYPQYIRDEMDEYEKKRYETIDFLSKTQEERDRLIIKEYAGLKVKSLEHELFWNNMTVVVIMLGMLLSVVLICIYAV
jgi:hypothetical protein